MSEVTNKFLMLISNGEIDFAAILETHHMFEKTSRALAALITPKHL